MKELCFLLERKSREGEEFRLLPVLYGISYEQCMSLKGAYKSEPWVNTGSKPAPDVLELWARSVKQLLEITAKREDQVDRYSAPPLYCTV